MRLIAVAVVAFRVAFRTAGHRARGDNLFRSRFWLAAARGGGPRIGHQFSRVGDSQQKFWGGDSQQKIARGTGRWQKNGGGE